MTTIVSCFLANSNSRGDRNTNKYIELGKKLLNVNIPKIIFMDDSIIDSIEYNKEKTILIPINYNDLFLSEYKNNITNFDILTDFSEKDTLDYMLLICNKTEFMKKAIEINTFKTEQFVWVDFGINHIFKSSDDEFEKKIINLNMNNYSKIRIGSIIDPNLYLLNKNIYKEVVWYFAGGVFGGNPEFLLKFADLVKKKCLEIILNKATIMWEVNIWYMVFLENKELFDLYFCDHNETLIENY